MQRTRTNVSDLVAGQVSLSLFLRRCAEIWPNSRWGWWTIWITVLYYEYNKLYRDFKWTFVIHLMSLLQIKENFIVQITKTYSSHSSFSSVVNYEMIIWKHSYSPGSQLISGWKICETIYEESYTPMTQSKWKVQTVKSIREHINTFPYSPRKMFLDQRSLNSINPNVNMMGGNFHPINHGRCG